MILAKPILSSNNNFLYLKNLQIEIVSFIHFFFNKRKGFITPLLITGVLVLCFAFNAKASLHLSAISVGAQTGTATYGTVEAPSFSISFSTNGNGTL